MTMWIIIMWTVVTLFVASASYIGIRSPNLLGSDFLAELGKIKPFSFGLLITLGTIGIITLCIDFINSVVCIISLALFWGVSDLVFWLIQKIGNITFEHYYAGWVAIILTLLYLSIGWYLDHHVSQTDYTLTTNKEIPNLKIALFADSHIGTTFNATGFAKHLKKIEAQNPDLLVISGDYVDDGTSKKEMIESTRALGQTKTKYGVFYVFGNHDKGYCGPEHRGFSEQELEEELKKNGIIVLRDEAVLVNDAFYVIGRRDFSEEKEQKGKRQSMKELTANLDKNKYMIVLDHQPTDFENQAKSEVDLVLCGHTHGGQLFPFNQVGKWIGANNLIYGHEKRNKTDFIVTSGISAWAIKFKTGTKSEFVIINIKQGE